MKILFDVNTPAPLARFMAGHMVVRAGELNWQGLENGALLDAAEQAGFELFVTCDQNIPYQQNFEGRRIAVLVLSSNHWPTISSVAERVAAAVDSALPGQVLRLDIAEMGSA